MKSIVPVLAAALAATLWTGAAQAWSSANRYGGSTSHSYGSTSHTNAWGGSSTHTAGEGTEHTNMYGGSTAHSAYGGTEHTNVYGGSTYGAYGAGVAHTYPSGATYYHPPTYPVYHPPVAVPYYSSGCYGCAAAAGAVVGAAVGAAAASANTASRDVERIRRGGCDRQRQHRRRDQRCVQRRSGHGCGGRKRACRRNLRDGDQLRDVASRLDDDQQGRHDVLPEWQHVVPAGVRRERRLLPRGACAITHARHARLCNCFGSSLFHLSPPRGSR